MPGIAGYVVVAKDRTLPDTFRRTKLEALALVASVVAEFGCPSALVQVSPVTMRPRKTNESDVSAVVSRLRYQAERAVKMDGPDAIVHT